MVKNLGGNKAKKSGNKYGTSSFRSNGLHMAVVNGELYAIITKLYGNGMCEAFCIDGVSRLCVIRKKFKGRRKKDNDVKLGTWVLVGLREWEVRNDGVQKTDLLTVYSDKDKERLISKSGADFTHLISSTKVLLGDSTDDDLGIKIIDNDVLFEMDKDKDCKNIVLDFNSIIDMDDI